MTAQFPATNLLGCNQISHVYLCNKTGILDKKLDQSCLGALYNQQFNIARTLCPIKIINAEEIIYRTINNRHPVYTPVGQDIPINCQVKVQISSSRGEYLSFNLIQDARPPSNTTTSLQTSRLPWTQALSISRCPENPKW